MPFSIVINRTKTSSYEKSAKSHRLCRGLLNTLIKCAVILAVSKFSATSTNSSSLQRGLWLCQFQSPPPPSARTLDGIQQVVGPHHGAFACKGLSPGGEEFDNLVKNKELCISKLFVNTQACVIGHQRG